MMIEFSLQECMKKLNIQEGSHLDKLQQLYCNLDQLILNERGYLSACMFDSSVEQAADVERNVWRGILLRALKMGMESKLGGAIKQETTRGEEILHRVGELNQNGVAGRICWAALPEGDVTFVMFKSLKELEKVKIRTAIESIQDIDNKTDRLRQFDIACDLMDLDKIDVCSKTSYLKGIELHLKMVSQDKDMADKLENEWLFYQKMPLSQRVKDFNRFIQDIRYVNELGPRPIARHDDNMNDDNQNQK